MTRALIALLVVFIIGFSVRYHESTRIKAATAPLEQQLGQAQQDINTLEHTLVNQQQTAKKNLEQVTQSYATLYREKQELQQQYEQAKKAYEKIKHQPAVAAWAGTAVPDSVVHWLRQYTAPATEPTGANSLESTAPAASAPNRAAGNPATARQGRQ